MTLDELQTARVDAGVSYSLAANALIDAYVELRSLETALQNAAFGMSHSLGPVIGTNGFTLPTHPKYFRDTPAGGPHFGDRIRARVEALLKPAPIAATPAAETTTTAEA